jgi:hypothetical protein
VVESLVLLGGFLLLADLGSLGLACAAILSYAVRLAITLPVVALRRNLAPRMLADPLFLCSVLAFGAALGVQWLRAG